MLRRLAPLLAALVTVPAGASNAHAWVELPAMPVAHDGVATCLRPDAPGVVSLLGPVRETSPLDLVRIDAGGLHRAGRVDLGALNACPAVAGPLVAGAGRLAAGAPCARATTAPRPWRSGRHR